ncbi:acyltransferase family protein [Niastella sp. OAS944]|uniref:acyltransferase family protein n=1 Tax=Niastella sp. OAS944 TaxID=2664089 RepID=UPI00348FB6D8|nr:peptidoglycan/LPS O-acetylase OafA/YrhL [Chitinophagaceae bacterium OAS944]
MNLTYHKELDGVRAIAVFMVIYFHFFYDLNLPPLVTRFANFGRTGVTLFFVLSGFLITRILIATKESPNYFSSFYVRRSLRIFPLYYFFLALIFIILPLISGKPFAPFNLQVYCWTYVQNFALAFRWDQVGPRHLWSLSVEEHFYLFWPLLIYLLSIRRIVGAIVLIIVMAFVIKYIMIEHDYAAYYFTFARIDELAIGALLAVLELKNKLTDKNANIYLLLSVVFAIPTIALLTIFTDINNSIIQIIKYNLLAFTFWSIVGYVISSRETTLVKRFLRSQPMVFAGKISYGLYIYHPLCIATIWSFSPKMNLALLFVFAVGFTFLAASASYYLLELNFLKLKRYFEYKKEKAVKPETSVILKKSI